MSSTTFQRDDWADRDFVIRKVRRSGSLLMKASPELKADKEVVLAAVKSNGYALQFASLELKADKEVVLAAVKSNGYALQFASLELKADKEVVLAAVKRNGGSLQYASQELRADRAVVLEAVKYFGGALPLELQLELQAERGAVLAAKESKFDYGKSRANNPPSLAASSISSGRPSLATTSFSSGVSSLDASSISSSMISGRPSLAASSISSGHPSLDSHLHHKSATKRRSGEKVWRLKKPVPSAQHGDPLEIITRPDGTKVRRIRRAKKPEASSGPPSLASHLGGSTGTPNKGSSASVAGDMGNGDIYTRADGKKVLRVKKHTSSKASKSSTANGEDYEVFIRPDGTRVRRVKRSALSAQKKKENDHDRPNSALDESSHSVPSTSATQHNKHEIYVRPDGTKVRRVKRSALGAQKKKENDHDRPNSALDESSHSVPSTTLTQHNEHEIYIRTDGTKVRRIKRSALAAKKKESEHDGGEPSLSAMLSANEKKAAKSSSAATVAGDDVTRRSSFEKLKQRVQLSKEAPATYKFIPATKPAQKASALSAEDDEIASGHGKMLKWGMPDGAVIQKMSADGVPSHIQAAVLAGDKPPKAAAETPLQPAKPAQKASALSAEDIELATENRGSRNFKTETGTDKEIVLPAAALVGSAVFSPSFLSLNADESGRLEFRRKIGKEESKISIRMDSLQEVDDTLGIVDEVLLKDSRFECSRLDGVVELIKTFEVSKPSATDSKIAKGSHESMSIFPDHGYSLQMNAHCITEAGKAGTNYENFYLARDDFMFTVELSKSEFLEGQGVHHAGRYVDFTIEIQTSGPAVRELPGFKFAYNLGEGARLDLTDRYFECDDDGVTEKFMPDGFPKVTIDDNDSGKFIATFRFYRFDDHRKIFYDPWFRFRDNRQGRFDVVSKIHPVPVPVNFGKDWPVSMMDSVVDAIDDARCKVYPFPAGDMEDLIYQVHMDGKEIISFNGKEAKGGHPSVMHLLDRANSWQDGKVLTVTISEADAVDVEKVPELTQLVRWRSTPEPSEEGQEQCSGYRADLLEDDDFVEIEALALHAKVKTELPIPTELFCRQSSRLDLLEEEDVLGKQPQVLDTTKTELTVPRQAIRRRLITGQNIEQQCRGRRDNLMFDDAVEIRALGLKSKEKTGEPVYQAYTGEIVTFEAPEKGCKSYQWDFGDGRNTNNVISHRVTHEFEKAGSFEVSLTFYDEPENTTKTITAGIVVKDTKCSKVTKYGTAVVSFLAVGFAVIEYLDIDVSELFLAPSSIAPDSDISGFT